MMRVLRMSYTSTVEMLEKRFFNLGTCSTNTDTTFVVWKSKVY